MKVLITRAQPAASQTASNLVNHGHEAIVLPIFELTDTSATIPEGDYDGIIFTSKNAIEILVARGWKLPNAQITAYCVGEKTEDSARAMGFQKTIKAMGGGKSLVETMAKMNLEGQQMLYPSTPDKSFDMAEALEPYGIDVITSDIYRAEYIIPDKAIFEAAVNEISNAYIFIYSALSAKHLAHLLEAHNLIANLEDCTLIGISGHALETVNHIKWKQILVADEPTEEKMIALLPK